MNLKLVRTLLFNNTSSRRNLSGLKDVFEKPNNIASIRGKFYANEAVGADNPTYLKESFDKVVFGFGIAGVTFGILNILNGLKNMSLGINKK